MDSGRNQLKAQRQRGASLVEFAIVIPTVCILIAAFVQVTILFVERLLINTATAQVAREIAISDSPTQLACDGSVLVQRLQLVATLGFFSPIRIDSPTKEKQIVKWIPADGLPEQRVQLTVSAALNCWLCLGSFGFKNGGEIIVTAQAGERLETQEATWPPSCP